MKILQVQNIIVCFVYKTNKTINKMPKIGELIDL